MEEMFCDSVLVTVFSSRSQDGGLMVHITEELPGKWTTLMFSCLNSNWKFSLIWKEERKIWLYEEEKEEEEEEEEEIL